MNIALFGGRFDPPHTGHLQIAEYILQAEFNIDEVWLIPANTHPWRPISASSKDRLEMTRLLVEDSGIEKIKVLDIDIKRGGDTFSIDTVNELLQNNKNNYFWIFGSDQIKNFPKWKDFVKLQKLVKFLVIPRKGYKKINLPKNFIILPGNYKPSNLSSSEIRDKIKNGLPISGLVTKKVEEYIKEKKLYVGN